MKYFYFSSGLDSQDNLLRYKDKSIIVYNKNDISGTAAEEKIKAVQVGYNLGPVVVTAEVADVENIDGLTAATASGQQANLRLSTKF